MSASFQHHFPFEPVLAYVRRNFDVDASVVDVAELLAERARLHGRDFGMSFTPDNVRRLAYRGLTSRKADAVATFLHTEPERLWPDWHAVHDAMDAAACVPA